MKQLEMDIGLYSVSFVPLPDYYFAEGTCRPGFEPYFCVMNPGSAEAAVNIIYRREIAGADDADAARKEKIEEYENLLYNPYIAASRGYIDGVIKPAETRIRLIEALELMSTKSESLPPKKHGNIPL